MMDDALVKAEQRLNDAFCAAERVGLFLSQWPVVAGDREVVKGVTFGDLRLLAAYVAGVALERARANPASPGGDTL